MNISSLVCNHSQSINDLQSQFLAAFPSVQPPTSHGLERNFGSNKFLFGVVFHLLEMLLHRSKVLPPEVR